MNNVVSAPTTKKNSNSTNHQEFQSIETNSNFSSSIVTHTNNATSLVETNSQRQSLKKRNEGRTSNQFEILNSVEQNASLMDLNYASPKRKDSILREEIELEQQSPLDPVRKNSKLSVIKKAKTNHLSTDSTKNFTSNQDVMNFAPATGSSNSPHLYNNTMLNNSSPSSSGSSSPQNRSRKNTKTVETRRRSRVILESRQKKRPNSIQQVQRDELLLSAILELEDDNPVFVPSQNMFNASYRVQQNERQRRSPIEKANRFTVHGKMSVKYLSSEGDKPINEYKSDAKTSLVQMSVHFPPEILLIIFSFMEPEDLGNVMCRVCKLWNNTAKHDLIWAPLALYYYPEETRIAMEEHHRLQQQQKELDYVAPLNPEDIVDFKYLQKQIDLEEQLKGRKRRKSSKSIKKKKEVSPQPQKEEKQFFRELFINFYVKDGPLLKTGVWRNPNWKPKKSPWSKEEFVFVHDSIKSTAKTPHGSIPIKVVVIGDASVGKTCLLCRYANGEFPSEDHLPTICDNFTAQTVFENQYYTVSIWDTAGIEAYDNLRPLSYTGADIFLLCFDLVKTSSLLNTAEKWIKELNRHAPNVPIMLCGNKVDLRLNQRYLEENRKKNIHCNPISFDEAVEVAKKIGCCAYSESSALTNQGVDKTFEEVMRIGFVFSFVFYSPILLILNGKMLLLFSSTRSK